MGRNANEAEERLCGCWCGLLALTSVPGRHGWKQRELVSLPPTAGGVLLSPLHFWFSFLKMEGGLLQSGNQKKV